MAWSWFFVDKAFLREPGGNIDESELADICRAEPADVKIKLVCQPGNNVPSSI